jgi:sterol desaturase/sphingolipid hydroxylase (fatty acid hydroxylase superfamily)
MMSQPAPFLHAVCMNEIIDYVLYGIREYAIYAGSLFVLLWIVLRSWVQHRKIQPRQRAGSRQWMREVGWSVVSQFVFTVSGLVVAIGAQRAFGTALIDIESWNSTLAVIGLALVFVLYDDATFYWIHRALHTKRLYRRFHLTHHRSVDVTPLTSFSFHPAEAFANAFPGMVLGVFVAAPGAAFYWLGWASLLNNLAGHCGFEWAPRWWHRVPLLGLKTPSMHHNQHHEKVRGNYGLYFTFWDRWCGTEFADYEQRWSELHDRIDGGRGRWGRRVEPATEHVGTVSV